jgi:hypothetical protein
MSETKPDLRDLPLFVRAEMALREAVAEVIEDHRRTGDPLVYWRDGKVVLVPADQVTPPDLDLPAAIAFDQRTQDEPAKDHGCESGDPTE